MSEKRKEGTYLCADLMACLGVLLLLGLEYFRTSGFIDMPVTYDSALPIAGRWFCLSGAMLLCACTGYVMGTKQLSWCSVRPFFRLIYIYLISSLGAMLVRRVIFDQYLTKEEIVDMLIQFTATDTAKFAGMYMLLLLFAPFLSAAFRDLHTAHAQFAFLAVTAGVGTLQPMLMLSGKYLLPEWCKMFAPFAGFLGGIFVRYYAKNLHRIAYLVLLAVLCGLQTAAVVYICTDSGVLYYPQFDSMASLPSLMTALLTLSLFHSEKRSDSPLNKFFSNASGGAIAALIIGDSVIDFVIPSLQEYVPELETLLLAGLIAVPVVFILCCTIGIFLQMPIFFIRTFFADEEEEWEEETEAEPEKAEEPEKQEEPEAIPAEPVRKPKPIRKLEPLTPVHHPEPKAEPIPEPEIQHIPEPEPVCESVPEPEVQPVPEPVHHKAQKPATLNEILEEQGIAVPDSSVDDLIAKIISHESSI